MIKFTSLLLLLFPLVIFCQTNAISFMPLPSGINTPDDEELGRWTIDGKAIIFTRLTKDHVDLLMAHLDSLGGVSGVEKMFFNASYKGGGHAISPDGKNLIVAICGRNDGLGGCDLYNSEFQDGAWTAPRNLGHAFNGTGWESQPAYGLDGLTIYFTSTRPGGYGGSDIWVVHQLGPNVWSNPINAGAGINTAFNEGSPFLHFDGRTMYFMRDGTEGFGGYDLYVSHLGIDGKWKSSENMGKSINSSADEGGLALNPDGKTAMITRSTTTQQNDLFEFQLPQQFQSEPIQALYVNVTDEETKMPVTARLEIFEINGRDTIRNSQQADEKGNITITLDRNKAYGLITSAKGYIMHSSNLKASQEASRKLDIQMIPLASSEKKTIALQNIFFESGSSILLPDSRPELNKLTQTLQTSAGMKIEIRGYTDNVGTEANNLRLSEARALSVYQYLIDKGIDKNRLSYKGLGETNPVANNDTEEGRRQNRRTEFQVLKL